MFNSPTQLRFSSIKLKEKAQEKTEMIKVFNERHKSESQTASKRKVIQRKAFALDADKQSN